MLLAAGHTDAADYPLGMLADEADIATERTNGLIATLGVVFQGAGISIMSKNGGRPFRDMLKQLSGD